MRYNGWTNRQTWCVNNWFDVADILKESYIVPGRFSRESAFLRKLAEYLREYVSNYVYEVIGTSGFVNDLIDLGDIDWHELCEEYANAEWEAQDIEEDDEEEE